MENFQFSPSFLCSLGGNTGMQFSGQLEVNTGPQGIHQLKNLLC